MSLKQTKLQQKCASTNSLLGNLRSSYIKEIWKKLFPVSFIQEENGVTQPETTKTGIRKWNTKRSFWTWLPKGTWLNSYTELSLAAFYTTLANCSTTKWSYLNFSNSLNTQLQSCLNTSLQLIFLEMRKDMKYMHSGSQSHNAGNLGTFQF